MQEPSSGSSPDTTSVCEYGYDYNNPDYCATGNSGCEYGYDYDNPDYCATYDPPSPEYIPYAEPDPPSPSPSPVFKPSPEPLPVPAPAPEPVAVPLSPSPAIIPPVTSPSAVEIPVLSPVSVPSPAPVPVAVPLSPSPASPSPALVIPVPPVDQKPTTSIAVTFLISGSNFDTEKFKEIISQLSQVQSDWIDVSLETSGTSSRRRRLMQDQNTKVTTTLYTTDPGAVTNRIKAAVNDGTVGKQMAASNWVLSETVFPAETAAKSSGSSTAITKTAAAIVGGVVAFFILS